MESHQALSACLLNLANESRGFIANLRDSGELVKSVEPHFVVKLDEFEFDQGRITASWSQSFETREIWRLRQVYEVAELLSKKSDHFQLCVREIVQQFGLTESQAAFAIKQFTQKVVRLFLETETASDKLLATLAGALLKDLCGEAIEWEVKVFLRGIWPEQESVEVIPGVALRRPIPDDFEEVTPVAYFRSAFDPLDTFSSVLSFTIISASPGMVQQKVVSWVDALRLFRLSSVTPDQQEFSPNSILRIGGTFWSGEKKPAFYKCEFTTEDAKKFNLFWSSIEGSLPTLKASSSPLGIGYARYEAALFDRLTESRVTSAITCLEALYLKASENMELSHKLSQRVACLLGTLGHGSALQIYKLIKTAYGIRSTFIHGGVQKENQRAAANTLCLKALDIARLSVTAFLLLEQGLTERAKGQFIDLIDNSMLDSSELEDLGRKIMPIRRLLVSQTHEETL